MVLLKKAKEVIKIICVSYHHIIFKVYSAPITL